MAPRHSYLVSTLFLCFACGLGLQAFGATLAEEQASSWPLLVRQALSRAGANRPHIVAALRATPPGQRAGMEFLVANMPDQDLQSLSTKFLRDNVSLAYQAHNRAPWKSQISQDVFLNDVLPYASLNEARDGSRRLLKGKSEPLIAGIETLGEAAQVINAKLFPLVNVVYSTSRNRPDQAPLETLASGKATCSGLSILLVDACRSVGIPARVVGTPLWSDGSGNHTWVEIWDNGWHFVGAAEPDSKGLDHAWFEHNASLSKRDVPANSIYATSFSRTGLSFPLVWAPQVAWVPAVNVTDRYAAAVNTITTRLLVNVLDSKGKRVPAHVFVRDIADGSKTWTGLSKGETADMRDFLAFNVPRERVYQISATHAGQTVRQSFAGSDQSQAAATLHFNPAPMPTAPLTSTASTHLRQSLAAYFAAPTAQQAVWRFPVELDALLLKNESAVRRIAWTAWQNAPTHGVMHSNFEAHQVTFEQYVSPYTMKTVGTRPANGWPLFIAMHGGGGAPKEVNDSQWQTMHVYYKDHPEKGGYQYLALRAPNDTWNGFYDLYVYPLVANLITQFRLYGDIDANKVFLMGYSHGGYGAFAIGPKEPDFFAAIHAAAAAPTDGETTVKTLRSTEFTCMVGDGDTMYDRLDRDKRFVDGVKAARGERADAYPVYVQIATGYQHSNLPDRDKIFDMYPAVRNPVPREVTWLMTDTVIHDLFWLHAESPIKEAEIDAACRDNHVTVTTTSASAPISAVVYLDSRLIDYHKPVTLTVNGRQNRQMVHPDLRTLCETLARRRDPNLAFTVALPLTP